MIDLTKTPCWLFTQKLWDNIPTMGASLIQFDGQRVSSQSNKMMVCSGLKYLIAQLVWLKVANDLKPSKKC